MTTTHGAVGQSQVPSVQLAFYLMTFLSSIESLMTDFSSHYTINFENNFLKDVDTSLYLIIFSNSKNIIIPALILHLSFHFRISYSDQFIFYALPIVSQCLI